MYHENLTKILAPEAQIKILFVSLYSTDPEKRGYSKIFISIFSQEYFFLISMQPERIIKCKQCYLSKLFVYIILLSIVGLYSKSCLKQPLKDIRRGPYDKWVLNAGQKYCRMLQYF